MQSRKHGNNANDERVVGIQNVITSDDRKEEEKESTKDDQHKIEEKLSVQENRKSMELTFNQ